MYYYLRCAHGFVISFWDGVVPQNRLITLCFGIWAPFLLFISSEDERISNADGHEIIALRRDAKRAANEVLCLI